MCDQISDAILDAHLRQDPDAKVACGKFKKKHSEWDKMSCVLCKTFVVILFMMQMIFCECYLQTGGVSFVWNNNKIYVWLNCLFF